MNNALMLLTIPLIILFGWLAILLFIKVHDFLTPTVTYLTVDGGNLAPHPNMTDEELYAFEKDMEIPMRTRTWKTHEEFLARKVPEEK